MAATNNTSSSVLKYAVLVFFFLLLILPMIQQHFPFVEEKNLEGVDNKVETPAISLAYWLDGTFQRDIDPALSVNIGFRKTLVRSFNQMNYSVFNISKVGAAVVGKNGFIYIQSYVDAYTGADFKGSSYIDIQTEKARIVQQELKKKNIDLVFAFAPGKGSYYREFLPDVFLERAKPDSTNYVCYTKALRNKGLNVLDLRSYFQAMKDTASNVFFPIPGVHWSEYASVVAFDTISDYVSQLKKIRLPSFRVSKMEVRFPFKTVDYDAAAVMNIFSMIPHEELPYVNVSYSNVSTSARPRLLTIADSYFSLIEDTHIPDSLFSKSTYWLYERRPSSDPTKEFDFRREVEERDVIMVLGTDATLGLFPYHFIDEAYEMYAPKNKQYAELKDREFRLYVYAFFKNADRKKPWRKQLMQQAKQKKISYTEECINNAVWLYNEQEMQNKKFVPKK